GIARNRPHLDERLPLPGAAERVVVAERAGQRSSEGSTLAFGPQAEIDAIRLSAIGVCREQPNQLGDGTRVELVVTNGPAAGGLPLVVVDEHQVDVAGIVQLAATELAKGEDRR